MKRPAILVLALLLAGCAQAPDASDAPATIAATTGGLHGTVVDAGIRPVANVTVQVNNGQELLRQNTTASGSFNFTGLRPGAHFLSASRAGFLTRQVSLQVEAGVSGVVRVQLEPDLAFRRPHIQSYEFKGIIQCGVVANGPPPVGYAAVAACNLPNEQLGQKVTDDKFIAQQALDGGRPTWVQADLIWQSQQPASNQLLLYLDEINTTGAGSAAPGSPTSAKFTELTSARGTSPVIAHLSASEVDRLGRGFDLQVRVFSWTNDQAPAGATAQQPFTVYTNIFYGFAPPPGWKFSDGLPAIPPE